MLKFKKVKFNIATEKLTTLPRLLAEKAFLVFLVLLAMSLLFGGFLFYRYGVLAKNQKIELTGRVINFQEENYREVLKIWQTRELRFKESSIEGYPNLFQTPLKPADTPLRK